MALSLCLVGSVRSVIKVALPIRQELVMLYLSLLLLELLTDLLTLMMIGKR